MLEYFPSSFECDLNGKTQSYEAIVLIPFVDEKRILEEEAQAVASKRLVLSEKETLRNTTSFGCFSYSFVPEGAKREYAIKPLESTLTHLDALPKDLSVATYNNEYASVGQFSFVCEILEGVVTPCPGFHSFKYLNVIGIEKDSVFVQKKSFERMLIKVPQAIQESQPQQLEKFV